MKRREQTGPVWKTRDGRLIRVRAMTDEHLTNTIRYLRRRAKWANYLDGLRFATMQGPNGEYGQLAFEQEIIALAARTDDEYLEAKLPAFTEMLIEAARRGLKL